MGQREKDTSPDPRTLKSSGDRLTGPGEMESAPSRIGAGAYEAKWGTWRDALKAFVERASSLSREITRLLSPVRSQSPDSVSESVSVFVTMCSVAIVFVACFAVATLLPRMAAIFMSITLHRSRSAGSQWSITFGPSATAAILARVRRWSNDEPNTSDARGLAKGAIAGRSAGLTTCARERAWPN